jgi:transcriptional regulator with XRE-family HTH domain
MKKPNRNTRFRQILFEKNLTQASFAKLCGINYPDISLLANGRLVPTEWMMDRICKALKMRRRQVFPEYYE